VIDSTLGGALVWEEDATKPEHPASETIAGVSNTAASKRVNERNLDPVRAIPSWAVIVFRFHFRPEQKITNPTESPILAQGLVFDQSKKKRIPVLMVELHFFLDPLSQGVKYKIRQPCSRAESKRTLDLATQ